MAFVLKKVSSYKWPVTVEVPVDGGKFKKETFTAIFKRMSRSAFNDLVEAGDDALVDQIIEGWEYNDENKVMLFDDPHVLRGVITAFTDSITGSQAKN
jgi:lantibiotic modifying enzyme